MAKLYNLARMTTATTGPGTLTLAGVVPGFLTFALAGVQNGDTVSYGIRDGNNSEVGVGVYTAAGFTLTRSVTKSTNGDAPLNLSGAAEVYITGRAEDLFVPSANDGNALGGPAVAFSDLYLANGGFINWANANITLTHAIGSLTLAGGPLKVPDDAYSAAGWDGNLEVPTKNAVRDKIESMAAGGGGTPSDTTPAMDSGTGAAGSFTTYSRGDHVHPTDTTRAAASAIPVAATVAPLVDATPAQIGASAKYAKEDHQHPTDTGRQAADADLAAIAALSGTGIARRTATDTWTVGGLVANAELATMAAYTFKGNNSASPAAPSDVSIAALTTKASPAGTDYLLLSDQAAAGAWKKILFSSMGGISDAPNDGLQYGRQSLGWTQITGGGGGATPSDANPIGDGTAAPGVSTQYSRGDHVHPLDAELAAIAGLASAADRVPYFTGPGAAALTPLTTFGRSLIDDADNTAAMATLGLGSAATATAAALSKGTDDTNITLTLTGAPATALLQATTITVAWTGTLSAARGGFGANISAAAGVPIFTAGVATFTPTTGSGNIARDSSVPVPATVTPLIDSGAGAVGASAKFAREDHVHPISSAGGFIILVSDTPPAGAADNALWWESDTGLLYVRYNDGNTTQWVNAAPQPDTSTFVLKTDNATTAQYLNNTAGKTLTTDKIWAAAAAVDLGTGASFAINFSTGLDFLATINSAATAFGAPTNIKAGQKGIIFIRQDGTGSRLITSWDAAYKFPGGTKPTLTLTANAYDAISYVALNSTTLFCTFQGDFK